MSYAGPVEAAEAQRRRPSTGAGGPRAPSCRARSSSTRRRRSASAWASAASGSRSRCRWRRSSCPRRGWTPPASLAAIVPHGTSRARRRTRSGKAYADVVRGFRGRIDHPPDLVAHPRERGRRRGACSAWCADAGVGGDPLRRRHQRRRWGRAARRRRATAGAVSIDLRGARPRARSRRDLARGADPGRGAGPGARGPAATLRPDAAPLPAVVRVLDPRRLDRDAGRRPLRDPLYTHIDDLVESVRAITPAGVWESRRLPGPAPGPAPTGLLIGSEGILGVDHRGLGAAAGAPTLEALVRRRVRRLRERAPGRFASSRNPGLDPSNCRLLDPAEAALTHAGPARQGAARARLRVGASPRRRADADRARGGP